MSVLLICSFTMAIVTAIYFILSPLLGKRYSDKGRYYAWLAIVLGYVIPFRPKFSLLTIYNWVSPVSSSTMPIPFRIASTTEDPISKTINAFVDNHFLSAYIMITIWLLGIVCIIVYHIGHYYKTLKMLDRWKKDIAQTKDLNLLARLTKDLKIRRKIIMQVCECIKSPMMIGFIFPRILLPNKEYSEKDLTLIIKHELIHVRRKDVWIKALVLSAMVIHWFNPFVYLMAQEINSLCESSCDAETIKGADNATKYRYQEIILYCAYEQCTIRTMLSTNFNGGKNYMKNRIRAIQNTSTKKMGVGLCGCIVISTLIMSVLFSPSTVSASKDSELDLVKTVDKAYDHLGIDVDDLKKELEAYGHKTEISQDVYSETELEQMRKNMRADFYEVYTKYDLSYNKEDDRLYYKGKTVRCFEDSMVIWPFANGEVDLYAARDNNGNLVGIKLYSQKEFDERTLELGHDIGSEL